jgi:Bacterial protein of unknown function (DUF937)
VFAILKPYTEPARLKGNLFGDHPNCYFCYYYNCLEADSRSGCEKFKGEFMNLLDMVKGQLTETVLGQLGKAVNLAPSDVSKAMEVIVPAQVSVLAQHGATPQGAQGLLGLLGNFANMGNFGSLLGMAGGAGGLLKIGETVLPALLGGKLPGVLSGLASHTGLGQGAIGGLMSLAGPLIMGQLGSHVKSTGMDAGGLGGLLGGLAGIVGPMLPSGLSSALNLGSAAGVIGAIPNVGGLVSGLMGGAAGAVGNVAASSAAAMGGAAAGAAGMASAVGGATAKAGGGIPWLPILGAAGVALAGWYFLGRGNGINPTATTPPPITTPDTSSSSTPTTSGDTMAAACTAAYSLGVTDGAAVTEPFQFGGTGKGKGYNITVYQSDGRKIGTKDLPNDKDCKWGYLSNPTKGNIKYEVREIGGTDIVSTVTLTVK